MRHGREPAEWALSGRSPHAFSVFGNWTGLLRRPEGGEPTSSPDRQGRRNEVTSARRHSGRAELANGTPRGRRTALISTASWRSSKRAMVTFDLKVAFGPARRTSRPRRGPPLGPRLRGEPGSAGFTQATSRRTKRAARPTPPVFDRWSPLQGQRLHEARPLHTEGVGPLARPHIRAFRRAAHCAVRAAGADSADPPAMAEPVGRQAAHGGLCAGVLAAFWPMLSIRSGSSREPMRGHQGAVRRRTVPRSSGPRPTLRAQGAGSPEIGHAADLAALTGLRLGDLLRLSWSHVGTDAIVITTSKSRQQQGDHPAL